MFDDIYQIPDFRPQPIQAPRLAPPCIQPVLPAPPKPRPKIATKQQAQAISKLIQDLINEKAALSGLQHLLSPAAKATILWARKRRKENLVINDIYLLNSGTQVTGVLSSRFNGRAISINFCLTKTRPGWIISEIVFIEPDSVIGRQKLVAVEDTLFA